MYAGLAFALILFSFASSFLAGLRNTPLGHSPLAAEMGKGKKQCYNMICTSVSRASDRVFPPRMTGKCKRFVEDKGWFPGRGNAWIKFWYVNLRSNKTQRSGVYPDTAESRWYSVKGSRFNHWKHEPLHPCNTIAAQLNIFNYLNMWPETHWTHHQSRKPLSIIPPSSCLPPKPPLLTWYHENLSIFWAGVVCPCL